jgi:hypothetical protein
MSLPICVRDTKVGFFRRKVQEAAHKKSAPMFGSKPKPP